MAAGEARGGSIKKWNIQEARGGSIKNFLRLRRGGSRKKVTNVLIRILYGFYNVLGKALIEFL